MPLFSAFEDFVRRTLAEVAGVWAKLHYVAGLKREGRYSHWGIARLHGERATQQALSEAHRSLFLQVLRTPLRELLEDAARSAADGGGSEAGYLEELSRRPLLPDKLDGGSARHFNSILKALWGLVKARKRAIPPAS